MFSDMLQYNVTLIFEKKEDQFLNEKKVVFQNRSEWVEFKRGTTDEEIK